MGKLHDRQRSDRSRTVPHWKKPCPDCGEEVERDTALSHLTTGHGCMFRVEGWMYVLGVPEESFDELLAFVLKLKGRKAP